MRHFRACVCAVLGLWFWAGIGADSGWLSPLWAELKPEEVAVIATADSQDSLEIAHYYMQARHLPEQNLLLLKKGYAHTTPREVWDNEIRPELRKWFLTHPQIRCAVCCWDVPLRIEAYHEDAPQVAERLARLKQWQQETFQQAQKLMDLLYSFYPEEEGKPKPEVPKLTAGDSAEKLGEQFEKALQQLQKVHRTQPPEVQDRFFKKTPLILQTLSGEQALLRMLSQQKITPVQSDTQTQLVQLRQQLQKNRQKIEALEIQLETRERDTAILPLIVQNNGILGLLQWLDVQIQQTQKNESTASFDSELSLILLENHAVFQWMPNFLSAHTARFVPNLQPEVELVETSASSDPFALPGLEEMAPPAGQPRTLRPMLMVARLEAPSVAIVKRMIDDALAVEKTGLTGTVYLDARWPRSKKIPAFGSYELTDLQLHSLAERLQKHTTLDVKTESTEKLMQRSDCPAPAALYCGWYSLAHYVDAFQFSRGAVAWHIASMEAVYLKKGKFWCPNLLSHGCAATLGATFEPYLTAFPDPDEFFALLLSGKYPLVECFYYTMPFSSWALTLVGDPLYTPYRKNPQLKADQLPATLKPFLKKLETER